MVGEGNSHQVKLLFLCDVCASADNHARRFKPPWVVESIAGGYAVRDATGQALTYVYARETRADALSSASRANSTTWKTDPNIKANPGSLLFHRLPSRPARGT